MMRKHYAVYDEEVTKLDGYAFTGSFWTDSTKATGINISADEFFLIIKKKEGDPDSEAKVLKQTSDFTFTTKSPSAVANEFTVTCSASDIDIPSGDYFRAIKRVPSGSVPHTFLKGTLRIGLVGIERSAEV